MMSELDEYDPEELTSEQEEELKSYIANANKEDKGTGLMDFSTLKSLFQKPVSIGPLGKSILNPMQVKKGADQILGVTSNDLNLYKKYKMIPFFLTTKTTDGGASTVSGHKSKEDFYVVFMSPAFGAVIKNDDELKYYQTIFPKFCQEVDLQVGDIIQDCDELPFVYVKGEAELQKLQTDLVTNFARLRDVTSSRKSDGNESEKKEQEQSSEEQEDSQQSNQQGSVVAAGIKEVFVYEQGLNFLVEANKKFPAKKFIDIINDTESEGWEGATSIRNIDEARVAEESQAITFQAYKRFVKIAYEEVKRNKEMKSRLSAGITQDFINSTSDTAQSLMSGYLGFVAVGALTGVVGLSTAGAGLAVLPYILGAKMATPGLSKGVSGIVRSFTKLNNYRKNKAFEKEGLNDQIKQALDYYLATGEEMSTDEEGNQVKSSKLKFNSVKEECQKLNKAFLHVFEETVKGDKNDDKRKENVLITHSDFETACNSKEYQLTQVNDIPQEVYQNFMIDCNDLLRQSKIEIKGMSEFSSKRKMGDGFYHEPDFGEDQNPKEMSSSEKAKTFREVVNQIPEDNDRTRIIKAAILVKLDSGDEEAANDLFMRIIEDPESFTKGVEEALGEETSDEDALKAASSITGSSVEDIKRKQTNMAVFFITKPELDILKDLDRAIMKSFGISDEDLTKATKQFQLQASGAYKIVEYDKRESLDEDYKELESLLRPNITSIRDSFSFPELVSNKINDKEAMKKILAFLFNIVHNVICGTDKFQKTEVLNFVGDIKFKDDNMKQTVNKSFSNIFAYVTKESLYDQVKELQAKSEIVKESKYYNRSLSNLLFENNLNNVSFK